MWWIVGGVVAAGAVGLLIWWSDQYGQGKRGLPRVPGRHEDTGEFPTVVVEQPKGYSDFRTAVIPVAQNGSRPVPRLAPRTDTVMMEAVDPAQHPQWIKDELEKYK